MDSKTIYDHVSKRYSATARGDTSTHHVQTSREHSDILQKT
jgi:hypothetical protein